MRDLPEENKKGIASKGLRRKFLQNIPIQTISS